MKKRWKNKGLWVSVAALILLILQNAGIAIDAGKYNEFVTGVLAILTMLGVISDPTTQNSGYLDDKDDSLNIYK